MCIHFHILHFNVIIKAKYVGVMLVTNCRIWRILSDFVIYNTASESAFQNIFKFRERQSYREKCPAQYPILDTRISVRSSVCHAQGTPPGF